jgi:hypothetical protein
LVQTPEEWIATSLIFQREDEDYQKKDLQIKCLRLFCTPSLGSSWSHTGSLTGTLKREKRKGED